MKTGTTRKASTTKSKASKTKKNVAKRKVASKNKGNASGLKKITTLAKKIRVQKPNMKWTNAIKEAAKQLRK